jgi:hypothetical protein
MHKGIILLFLFFFTEAISQQNQALPPPEYNRKEEIIYMNNRYRLHTNYLTLGAGYANSTLRNVSQRIIAADFNYHIRQHRFQTGALMSGDQYLSNNYIQLHLGYGLKREGNRYLLAGYAGPSLYHGVYGDQSGAPIFYRGVGAYFAGQAVTKLAYDIGLGLEVFGDFNTTQSLYGFKIIGFFSGAYRGPKRNYNPNVRSENPG